MSDNSNNIIDGLDEIEIENTSIDDIATENVNLMFIGIDCSGSMSDYIDDMEQSLSNFKSAISNSKEADEILLTRANFNRDVTIGGYKKIDDFDTSYSAYGYTSLYDTIVIGSNKLVDYMTYLKEQGMRVKAVFVIFSDGADNTSRYDINEAKAEISKLNKMEITTAFISFGNSSIEIANSIGFKNIMTVKSDASELRKAFDCLSKSAISASKSVIAPVDNFFV